MKPGTHDCLVELSSQPDLTPKKGLSGLPTVSPSSEKALESTLSC